MKDWNYYSVVLNFYFEPETNEEPSPALRTKPCLHCTLWYVLLDE